MTSINVNQNLKDINGKPIKGEIDGQEREMTLALALQAILLNTTVGDDLLTPEQRFKLGQLAHRTKLGALEEKANVAFSAEEIKILGDRAGKMLPTWSLYQVWVMLGLMKES